MSKATRTHQRWTLADERQSLAFSIQPAAGNGAVSDERWAMVYGRRPTNNRREATSSLSKVLADAQDRYRP